jgi:hypothetical protein
MIDPGVTDAVNCGGCEMITVATAEVHPAASVIKTEFVPAHNPDNVEEEVPAFEFHQ